MVTEASSLATPTTAERTRWQRQALDAMSATITTGAKAGLSPLTWQLGLTGCAGSVSTLHLTVAEQERQLRAWADVLGWPVVAVGDCLRAQEPVPEAWMTPRVVISVKLFDWSDADA